MTKEIEDMKKAMISLKREIDQLRIDVERLKNGTFEKIIRETELEKVRK